MSDCDPYWLLPYNIVWRLDTIRNLQREAKEQQKQHNDVPNQSVWEFWINCAYEVAPTNLMEWMVFGSLVLTLSTIGSFVFGVLLGLVIFVLGICIVLTLTIGTTICMILSMLTFGFFFASVVAGCLAGMSVLATATYVLTAQATQFMIQLLFGAQSSKLPLKQNNQAMHRKDTGKVDSDLSSLTNQPQPLHQ
eukprot:TRINITY_DN447_c1_g2_i2.p3 TRINITY_DN447_c1_g2~~TRINITY_DN447_c1_g2_i2.p3  ORF type:complete len:193 (-),score=11.80 TRINITY_DN447_c1_g2_i2:505-1083(-)